MGKIGYNSITLTDLTETLPISLILETNQNIQTKMGDLYTPNFSEEGKELIITPSLFLGREKISIPIKKEGLDSNYIYYQVGEIDENGIEKNYFDESTKVTDKIWVDEEGKLHYQKNLIQNLTIEAYIKDYKNETHNYTIDLIQAMNPVNILFLEDNNQNYQAIITSTNDREFFNQENISPIELTASLYNGTIPIENVDYFWDIVSDKDDGSSSDWTATTQVVEIERNLIKSAEIFCCTITDKNTGISYKATKILHDFTDSYSGRLISNKPLIFSPKVTEITLTNQIWYKTEIINEDNLKNTFEYKWSVLKETGGSSIEIENSNQKELTVTVGTENFPKENFTILCETIIDNKVSVLSYAEFKYQPINYSVNLSPTTFFVPATNKGKFRGEEEFIDCAITFKLLDDNKQPLIYNTISDAQISLNKENSSDLSKLENLTQEENKWSFSGILKIDTSENNDLWAEETNSKTYSFSYQYLGQPFTEQIEIVKNYAGLDGTSGDQAFSGYTIDLSNEFHAFSGSAGMADPNQEAVCYISAFWGDQPKKITEIKLDENNIIYSNKDDQTVYKEVNYLDKNLFIRAEGSTDNEIKIILRTNDSNNIEEKSLFLTEIFPISFYISIEGLNGNTLTVFKRFSYTINYNGKNYYLNLSSQNVKYSEATGKYFPEQILVSGMVRAENGESSIYEGGKIIYSFDEKEWFFLDNGIIENYSNLEQISVRLYSSNSTIIKDSINLEENEKYLLDIETVPVLTSLDGYEFGGENLLRWTKKMPLEVGKWQKISDTKEIALGEDGDFATLDFNLLEHEEDVWYGFKTPLIKKEEEYIDKDFCLSCYVWAEDWSEANFGGRIRFTLYGLTDVLTENPNVFANFNLTNITGMDVTETGDQFLETVQTQKKVDSSWVQVFVPFTLNKELFNLASDSSELQDIKFLGIKIAKRNGLGNVRVKKLKLEQGNIPTSWSANSYDLTYYDINGTNLLINPSLNYVIKGTDNEDKGYRVLAENLKGKTFYSVSWESIEVELDSLNFTYEIISSAGEIIEKIETVSKTNYSFSFETGEDPSYEIRFYAGDKTSEGKTINPKEILTFHQLKVEEGKNATPYTLTNNQIQDLLTQVKVDSQNYADSINKDVKVGYENGIPVIITADGQRITFVDYDDFENYLTEELNPKIEALESGILEIKDTDLVALNDGLAEYKKQIQLHNENNNDPYIEIYAGLNEINNSMKLTKSKLSFSIDGNEVAYFGNNKLYITQADITTTLRIGTSTTEGGLGFLVFTTTKDTGVTVTWSTV